MRIAFVVHGFPPQEAAGVELVASEQAQALAARGHSVHVFARRYGPDADTAEELQGDVRVVRTGAAPGAFPDLASTWDNHAFDDAFERFLDEARPDVVHLQHTVMLSPNLVSLAGERGLPTVLTLHDAWHLCHRLYLLDRDGERCAGPDEGARCDACLADLGGGSLGRSRFDFMARAIDRVDRVLAPSRALAARHEDAWPFLAGRIEVADPGLARPPSRREGRTLGAGRAGDPLRIVFVGTWLPHKGLDLLVRAVARLDPVRFRLAIHGAGVAGREAWVETLRADSRDLPVEWRGVFPPERLEGILGEADVLVLPSRCDESWSRAVREARSAGLAVVAPATGGPGEALVDGRDALLV
ncbi:MAG: glycosyltransferase, partial [Alphaproteobacteria bacterium]